jgi:hypothetical protein
MFYHYAYVSLIHTTQLNRIHLVFFYIQVLLFQLFIIAHLGCILSQISIYVYSGSSRIPQNKRKLLILFCLLLLTN